jgi:hypothetical protein
VLLNNNLMPRSTIIVKVGIYRILVGAPRVAIAAAIDNGDIKVEGGSKEDVQQFFSYFGPPPDLTKIDLIVR